MVNVIADLTPFRYLVNSVVSHLVRPAPRSPGGWVVMGYAVKVGHFLFLPTATTQTGASSVPIPIKTVSVLEAGLIIPAPTPVSLCSMTCAGESLGVTQISRRVGPN